MELSLGIGELPMMWRAKVIVNDVNKKRMLIHFSFRSYYTKFTAQNQNSILKSLVVYTNIACILSLTALNASAQFFPPENYPQNYFSWPVIATKALSANFGELRPNHYHMGFDCRTDKKQNLPIVAAADGYITRVRIEPFGFGRSLYIDHPNGFTTVYAHLNEFFPELEKYVKEQQYKLKSWKVNIDIPGNVFPVKKDSLIAFSGNTGSSQGPHLHFEIRDTKTGKVLNPGLFGFSIPDTIPPDIARLAVYDRRLSMNEQTPELYPLKKVDGIYVPKTALIIAGTDKVSFGISASDRVSGSTNPNGIYEAALFENENPLIGYRIDEIGYDETRYFNAHIDYKLRSSGGPYIQLLSRLPGYTNSIYRPENADGVISIDDTSVHKMKIEVRDSDGNSSIIQFEIKKDSAFSGEMKKDSLAFFQPGEFHPGLINVFERDNIIFYLPENCLYDSLRFRYSEQITKTGYPIYQLHNVSVPLHTSFPVTIKASTTLPGKMVMQRFANGKKDFAKAEPVRYGREDGWFRASFRDFGSFQLMVDTVSPRISPLGFKDKMNCSKLKSIRFVVTDNTEEIKKFTATLDGNWLRFSNDKGRIFIYGFDEMCPAGEHELKIVAEDQLGNITEKVYHFTR